MNLSLLCRQRRYCGGKAAEVGRKRGESLCMSFDGHGGAVDPIRGALLCAGDRENFGMRTLRQVKGRPHLSRYWQVFSRKVREAPAYFSVTSIHVSAEFDQRRVERSLTVTKPVPRLHQTPQPPLPALAQAAPSRSQSATWPCCDWAFFAIEVGPSAQLQAEREQAGKLGERPDPWP